jgi:hypothetical protein
MSANNKKTDSAAVPPVDNNPESKKESDGRATRLSQSAKPVASQSDDEIHDGCSAISMTPYEWEREWYVLLARWHNTYRPAPGSVAADLVLRTVQAEWFRLRAQRDYDDFLCVTNGMPLFTLPPKEIKMHDRLFRQLNSAELAFDRQFRLLEQHYKNHNLRVADLKKALPDPYPSWDVYKKGLNGRLDPDDLIFNGREWVKKTSEPDTKPPKPPRPS